MLMQDFQDQLVNVFVNCDLPMENKRYVVLEFANQVERTYQTELAAFRKKQAEEIKKKQAEEQEAKKPETEEPAKTE